jgi:hypothetical protein
MPLYAVWAVVAVATPRCILLASHVPVSLSNTIATATATKIDSWIFFMPAVVDLF